MAASLFFLKKYEAALESMNNALLINPKNVEVLNVKGQMLQNVMQRYDEALQCYDAALVLDPNNTVVLNNKQNLLDLKLRINWNEVIKKEVSGIGEYDLGVVHTIESDHVVTIRGFVNKIKFCLPKNLAERFDGHKLWFRITKDEAQQYRCD